MASASARNTGASSPPPARGGAASGAQRNPLGYERLFVMPQFRYERLLERQSREREREESGNENENGDCGGRNVYINLATDKEATANQFSTAGRGRAKNRGRGRRSYSPRRHNSHTDENAPSMLPTIPPPPPYGGASEVVPMDTETVNEFVDADPGAGPADREGRSLPALPLTPTEEPQHPLLPSPVYHADNSFDDGERERNLTATPPRRSRSPIVTSRPTPHSTPPKRSQSPTATASRPTLQSTPPRKSRSPIAPTPQSTPPSRRSRSRSPRITPAPSSPTVPEAAPKATMQQLINFGEMLKRMRQQEEEKKKEMPMPKSTPPSTKHKRKRENDRGRVLAEEVNQELQKRKKEKAPPLLPNKQTKTRRVKMKAGRGGGGEITKKQQREEVAKAKALGTEETEKKNLPSIADGAAAAVDELEAIKNRRKKSGRFTTTPKRAQLSRLAAKLPSANEATTAATNGAASETSKTVTTADALQEVINNLDEREGDKENMRKQKKVINKKEEVQHRSRSEGRVPRRAISQSPQRKEKSQQEQVKERERDLPKNEITRRERSRSARRKTSRQQEKEKATSQQSRESESANASKENDTHHALFPKRTETPPLPTATATAPTSKSPTNNDKKTDARPPLETNSAANNNSQINDDAAEGKKLVGGLLNSIIAASVIPKQEREVPSTTTPNAREEKIGMNYHPETAQKEKEETEMGIDIDMEKRRYITEAYRAEKEAKKRLGKVKRRDSERKEERKEQRKGVEKREKRDTPVKTDQNKEKEEKEVEIDIGDRRSMAKTHRAEKEAKKRRDKERRQDSERKEEREKRRKGTEKNEANKSNVAPMEKNPTSKKEEKESNMITAVRRTEKETADNVERKTKLESQKRDERALGREINAPPTSKLISTLKTTKVNKADENFGQLPSINRMAIEEEKNTGVQRFMEKEETGEKEKTTTSKTKSKSGDVGNDSDSSAQRAKAVKKKFVIADDHSMKEKDRKLILKTGNKYIRDGVAHDEIAEEKKNATEAKKSLISTIVSDLSALRGSGIKRGRENDKDDTNIANKPKKIILDEVIEQLDQ